MHRIRPRNLLHIQPRLSRLLGAGFVFLVVVGLALIVRPASAQMEFDYNGDGEVHCNDFKQQFPDTFTDEATKALQQYPDDLSDLNDDPKEDDLACEGQPGSDAAADTASSDAPAKQDAASTPAPTPAPEPPASADAPAAAPTTGSTESVDIPADVMARVEGCAVIAISSRDVTGAGCPGVGAVAFRIPDDAPAMNGTIIMNPGAALQQEPAASPSSSAGANGNADTRANDASSSGKNDQGGKAGKGKKDDSADTSKANTNKNNGKTNEDKHTNNKHKHKHKNGKNDKHGKKSKKHGKKGK